ncbi:hypothetical protein [Marinicellulosiphila megalodicopiae]|uniref:hypothetical protein n=1 Tax=Marinicellulosiphila megalodicopiae TaxID=2724896 RepID=UPI003BAE966C
MGVIMTVFLGALGSVLASLLIIYFLYNIRPKISISPLIACSSKEKGDTTFKIKVINKTTRKVIDLKGELTLVKPINRPEGIGKSLTNIPLKTESLLELSECGVSDEFSDFAFHFMTTCDLHKVWGDDAGEYLRFRIKASDSLSNHTCVFTKVYHNKSTCIVNGISSKGDTLEVAVY